MKVIIRPASAADANSIALLNEEVQQLHAELEPTFFRADTSHGEVAAFFAAKLSVAEHNIRLAEIEGTPVGYVWFEMQDRPETPFQLARKRIYIHHLSAGRSLVEPA
jgi:diamine N-acetyltransferase